MILLLACSPFDSSTSSRDGNDVDDVDTAVDTADTGPGPGPSGSLDACAIAQAPLTEVWTGEVEEVHSLTRMGWHDGLLALVHNEQTLYVAEFDSSGEALDRVFSTQVFDAWQDLHFRGDGLLVLAGERRLYPYWPREGTDLATVVLDGDGPVTAVSAGPEGARAVTPSGVYALDPEDGEGNVELVASPVATPLVGAGREGSAHSRGDHWVAGTGRDGSVAVAYDDATGGGYTRVTTLDHVFGDPVSVVVVPGGGVVVAGGPDGYAWFAVVDSGGVVTASVQYESPGISRLVVSEGSAFGWTSFDGMGVFATALDQPDYRLLTDEPDVVDLVVDPGGDWLLTGATDGTLRRWACALGD